MTVCAPWRVADSLNRLLSQVDSRSSGRSKASDGSIGDAAHQAEACSSEHNTCCTRYLGIWIVRARDFTHDPAHGADMNLWAEALRASRDARIRYLIWNRRITGPNHKNALGQWVWDPYSGDSPHTEHMHVSTWNDVARFDNTAPWAEPGGAVPAGAGGMNEDMAIIAKGPDGQLYLCTGGFSHKISAANIADIKYVASQGAYTLAHGADGAEWEQGGYVRKGWSEAVFGEVWRPAQAAAVDPAALAAALGPLLEIDIDQDDVAAALESARGQTALVQAANKAEDS